MWHHIPQFPMLWYHVLLVVSLAVHVKSYNNKINQQYVQLNFAFLSIVHYHFDNIMADKNDKITFIAIVSQLFRTDRRGV